VDTISGCGLCGDRDVRAKNSCWLKDRVGAAVPRKGVDLGVK
jgi:hypothetical protein